MLHLLLIAGLTWAAVLSPGADFAMVSRNSCLYGRRAGLTAAGGIALGCWFHVFYALFGLTLLERLVPDLLGLIKILGALYLIYIGITTIMARPSPAGSGDARPQPFWQSLSQGLLTNGLNPKTAIFVISLYTQVIGQETPLAFRLGCGLFISLSHLAWFAVVAVFLSAPTIRGRLLARQRLFNRAIGAVLTILGILLAVADLPEAIKLM